MKTLPGRISLEKADKKIFYCYALLDSTKPAVYSGEYSYSPKTNFVYEPFYIGQGHGKRSEDHIKIALRRTRNGNGYVDNSHKARRIRKILRNGGQVIIVKTQLGTHKRVNAREIELIDEVGRRDLDEGPLTNHRDGGGGGRLSRKTRKKLSIAAFNQVRYPVTDDTRAKLKEAAKHRPPRPSMSLAQRKKLSLANIGKTLSLSTRQKISEANIGRVVSLSTRNKISEAQLGTKRGPMSEENKRKISVALTGIPKTPEHVAKVAAANLGRKNSKESKRRMSIAASNRPPITEQHRLNLSIARKLSWIARKAKK